VYVIDDKDNKKLVGGQYFVQGYSKSLSLVLIESPYATSYISF